VSFQTIELTVADHLARLTLKRPHSANAINPVMAEELWLATIACEESPDVRAVLITSEGRFFCAGGDLGSFAGAGPTIGEQLAKMTGFIHGAFSKLARMTAPVVIAVNGAAAGAGLSLALLGDIVVAAKSATFTSGYTAAGLTPDGGSTYLLPRLVGYRRAQEMVLCNRRVGADEALQWGLVTAVVEDDQLLARAEQVARQLIEGPLQAIGGARRLLLASAGDEYETQMEREARAIIAAAKGAEGQEGIAAFLAKRRPNFLNLESGK
jgi:2-(1,2-epoxy-1,2-dihydrophenyl)acetyl-CoA isomerase